jgi:hypothetical protein
MKELLEAFKKTDQQPGKIFLACDEDKTLYLIGNGGLGTGTLKRVDQGSDALQDCIYIKIKEGHFEKEIPEKLVYIHEIGKQLTLFKYLA